MMFNAQIILQNTKKLKKKKLMCYEMIMWDELFEVIYNIHENLWDKHNI